MDPVPGGETEAQLSSFPAVSSGVGSNSGARVGGEVRPGPSLNTPGLFAKKTTWENPRWL